MIYTAVAAFIGAFAALVSFTEITANSKTFRYVAAFIVGLVLAVVLVWVAHWVAGVFHHVG